MTTPPFDVVEAASRMGFPGRPFELVTPYLDEVYWVIIRDGERSFGGPVIVENGHIVLDRGYAAPVRWIKRSKVLAAPEVDARRVAQVFERYDGLPVGWSSVLIDGHDPQTGERGGFRVKPFEIKLVSPAYIRPQARNPVAPGPGMPPTPPPVGPPAPGGWAPPRPSRATLREVDGKMTWIIEAFDPSAGVWRVELREPAEASGR